MDSYDRDIAAKANRVCELLSERERRGWDTGHELRTLLLDWQDAVMRKAIAEPREDVPGEDAPPQSEVTAQSEVRTRFGPNGRSLVTDPDDPKSRRRSSRRR